MMIPMEVTGVDPTFAAFIPEPERQLVQNLRPGEGILSESEANLRGPRPRIHAAVPRAASRST